VYPTLHSSSVTSKRRRSTMERSINWPKVTKREPEFKLDLTA
jgi:hypothetical protein